MSLDFEYQITFIVATTLCILMMLSMAYKMNKNIGSLEVIRLFRFLQISAIIVAFMQTIWMFGHLKPGIVPVFLNWIINMVDLIATGLIVYFWFRFIYTRVKRLASVNTPELHLWVQRIPISILVLLNVTSIWTHAVFFIDENNIYVRGPYYLVHVFLCYSYYIASVFFLCKLYKATPSYTSRKQVIRMLGSTLLPILGGVLQVLIQSSAPFTVITTTLATFYLFINLQEEQITTDALTGLSNRGRLDEILERKLKVADGNPFALFMSDIDHFKKINDSYGHVSGDSALILLANTFRSIGGKYHSFIITRYGGDEFAFMLDLNDEISPEELIRELRQELSKEEHRQKLGFDVQISVGYYIVNDSNQRAVDVIRKADRKLYEEKQKRKAMRI